MGELKHQKEMKHKPADTGKMLKYNVKVLCCVVELVAGMHGQILSHPFDTQQPLATQLLASCAIIGNLWAPPYASSHSHQKVQELHACIIYICVQAVISAGCMALSSETQC